MSSMKFQEKAMIEKLFDMHTGYVLNFSDSSFGSFFYEIVDIDIHNEKYQKDGTSKAKKLRAFWDLEDDRTVGLLLKEMIDKAEAELLETSPFAVDPDKEDKLKILIEKCKSIPTRLLSGQINLNHLKLNVERFDANHLAEQIRRIENSVNDDPALAIGTAKELIETCCKTILEERGKTLKGTPDIPTLTKATLTELKLVPEGINDEARGSKVIKVLLSNLGTIGNGLAELRGLYGTGHGKLGNTNGLSARHAKLAVGAASTLTTFLFDTHIETKKS